MKTQPPSNNLINALVTVFYTSAIAVQLLVILKVIPYTWVNGGMSDSYEAQAVQSAISLVIIIALCIFVRSIVKQGTAIKKWKLIALYVITFLWVLGLLMQIAGTEFERFVLSFMLLIGVVSHVLLVRKVRA